MKRLILATRKSPLALWQAQHVRAGLLRLHPGLEVELLGLTTTADRLAGPLHATGGKGLFVKELEEALLEGKADIAVHSMKDMPVTLPAGLALPVMCERENPRDVMVAPHPVSLDTLPPGTRIGTGSPRRECQLLAAWPHLAVASLRGNINTRLNKVLSGEYGAIILALAGLSRLQLTESIQRVFTCDEILPAAGQGAIGVECRLDDAETQALIAPLNHKETLIAVTAERSVCRALGAGCHTPVAAFAEIRDNQIVLRARVGSLDGKTLLRAQANSTLTNPEALGEQVALQLLAQGAKKILANSDIFPPPQGEG